MFGLETVTGTWTPGAAATSSATPNVAGHAAGVVIARTGGSQSLPTASVGETPIAGPFVCRARKVWDVDTDDWKRQIVEQAQTAARQALVGLAGDNRA